MKRLVRVSDSQLKTASIAPFYAVVVVVVVVVVVLLMLSFIVLLK